MYQSGQSQSVDGIQGGLPSKTPVSLLQELCMRRGISPKYDLLQIEGPVHEPTFVYRVTVGEYAANGSGQTKKKAKHAAAKAVLDIIIQGGSGSQGQSGGSSDLAQIVSPYDDGIPGNPVGALQELCMSRRWPPPTYKLTGEEGFPHERTFSICCTIGNHKEIGAGKSKKLSKRQAAHKMLQKLKDQPVEHPPMSVLADDDDEVKSESACPVPAGSRPSLSNACPKGENLSTLSNGVPNAQFPNADSAFNLPLAGMPLTLSSDSLKTALSPYSVITYTNSGPLKATCPHLSPVSNELYRVCEACFNLIENESGREINDPLGIRRSYDYNGTTNVVDSNGNPVREKPLDKQLTESDHEMDEYYIVKVEQMFDKLFSKPKEGMNAVNNMKDLKGEPSSDEDNSSDVKGLEERKGTEVVTKDVLFQDKQFINIAEKPLLEEGMEELSEKMLSGLSLFQEISSNEQKLTCQANGS